MASLFSMQADAETYDVVIYGGTSAAVTAAVQAKRMNQSVIVVSPDRHLGGLTSGGLGWTDTGNKYVIGGLAKEFYQAVYRHYQNADSWNFQQRAEYGDRAQGHRASDDDDATMWVFEPHVAEDIFNALIAEHQIPVIRDAWLDRENGVVKKDKKIVSITTLDGETYSGRQFIDATYEGDLVAAAGVETTTGRESVAAFDEPHAGVQTGIRHHQHHFGVLDHPVDPYVVPGDPSSGVIPRVSSDPPGADGSGDDRIQAYCFRTCFTNHAPNRVPFPKPEGYDPSQYEVLVRCFEAGWKDVFKKFDPLPNFKTDTNNHGPVSFDNIGYNYDYPDASYERRAEIIREHETYQKGILYFIAHDPRVPQAIQEEMQRWGLAKDEFTDNGNWPHQIYVREARRMVGKFIITENHLRKKIDTPESVGMGSYSIDSHNTQRYISPEGTVQNEGDIGVSTRGPYEIAMGCLLPRSEQCVNLTVPICVSSTHMAFGSIRMEPVFMILGQSAATLSAMANELETDVQKIRYDRLKKRLLDDGQILHTPPRS
ncbi:FAD-dependent oxidoreductase [Allorhodopirellula solitaria]